MEELFVYLTDYEAAAMNGKCELCSAAITESGTSHQPHCRAKELNDLWYASGGEDQKGYSRISYKRFTELPEWVQIEMGKRP